MVKFAFWRYDLFPFVLGAKSSIAKSGDGKLTLAEPPGYGGHRFVVRHLMSVAKGQETLNKLEDLRRDYEWEKRELEARYIKEALEIAPFLKRFPSYRNC